MENKKRVVFWKRKKIKKRKKTCPKCGYSWFTRQVGYINCSACKKYFWEKRRKKHGK